MSSEVWRLRRPKKSRLATHKSPDVNSYRPAVSHQGSRQQLGLQGPISAGGQPLLMGRAPPEATRPAEVLINFSSLFESHFGQ
ncbi:MAG: hypothetical protein ABGZ23_03755 [Fuerstiella sp.]